MKMDLRAPCADCPFRADRPAYLSPERADEILAEMIERDGHFSCHKHNDFDDDGQAIVGPDAQHCAGALIMLERLDRPNQWMRIMERLGLYDRQRLKMDSPVYASPDAMRAACRRG